MVQNRRFRSNAGRFTKISGRSGRPPPTILFSHKTRLNNLSHGIKICTDFSFVLSQCTRLTDGRTDRRTNRQKFHRKNASAFHAARQKRHQRRTVAMITATVRPNATVHNAAVAHRLLADCSTRWAHKKRNSPFRLVTLVSVIN